MEPDLLQLHHLERHQGVIDEERMAANDRQVREQVTDAPQSVHPENTEDDNASVRVDVGGKQATRRT